MNAVIAVVNVASQATDAIQKIVTSISGIVQQVSQDNTPDNRKEALQNEANSLVEGLKKAVNSAAPDGTKPLAGDSVRFKIEERIGKALDVLLPDHSKDAFGIGTINFSTKESIIQTQTSVATAQKQIEELRQAVVKTTQDVKARVDEIDVASQNQEASQSSVRDLDLAIQLSIDA